VEQYYALTGTAAVEGELLHTEASIWGEELSVSSPETKVLLHYGKANGWLDGKPAVITRRVGTGSITYVGTVFDEAAMKTLTGWLLGQAHVALPALTVPDDVEASVRVGEDRKVHILVNFGSKEESVHLPSEMKDEMNGGRNVRDIVLPASGVAVLREPR
jgi:beta-galactosidase